MNKKVKKMWVDALRSRKYKQGQGFLKNENKYCCLGVLCDIYRKKTKLGSWGEDGCFYTENGADESTLPDDVAIWADLANDPLIDSEETLCASSANDNGKKFYEIARMIERNL